MNATAAPVAQVHMASQVARMVRDEALGLLPDGTVVAVEIDGVGGVVEDVRWNRCSGRVTFTLWVDGQMREVWTYGDTYITWS